MSNPGTYRIENYTAENPVTGEAVERRKILYFTPAGEFELEEEFYGEIRAGYIQQAQEAGE